MKYGKQDKTVFHIPFLWDSLTHKHHIYNILSCRQQASLPQVPSEIMGGKERETHILKATLFFIKTYCFKAAIWLERGKKN